MYRNYKQTNMAVEINYLNARQKQNYKFAEFMIQQNYSRHKIKMNIWEVIHRLDSFVDLSDPDITLPNSHHAFQTAEGARIAGEPEWMQVVCLIHDLGKIMYLWGSNKTGTTLNNQWAIVGDTFITGCPIPNEIVYPEFNQYNLDTKNNEFMINDENNYGIYKKGCGLDNVIVSWGHDEYLYRVISEQSRYLLDFECKLPKEALYIIRYHSLYLWHDKEKYQEIVNQQDRDNLKWLKKFNKYDLYTKQDKKMNIDELEQYYDSLLKKYFSTLDWYW